MKLVREWLHQSQQTKRASDVKQHIEEYLKQNKYNIGLKIDIQSKIGGSDWKD